MDWFDKLLQHTTQYSSPYGVQAPLCPNCDHNIATYRTDDSYYPWNRVYKCVRCELEYVAVATPSGVDLRVVGFDKIPVRGDYNEPEV